MSSALMEHMEEEIIVPEKDILSFLNHIDWDIEQVMRREFPEGYESLTDIQMALIGLDPYLWCKFFLQEEEDPASWGEKGPWNFFDYQIPSIRWKGSFIHMDGAETGKTREIKAKILYHACNTPGGSGLIGAPESDNYQKIISGVMDQLESGELKGMLKAHNKQPHHNIILKNGFDVGFRPSKNDGKTFRSHHPKTFAFKDEAAKDTNKLTWSEFIRAMQPGCILGAYSVPDGRRNTEFYRLAMEAFLMSQGIEYPSDGGGWLHEPIDFEHFRRFHWPKTIMPAPFWSPKRKRVSVKLYGGEDSQGYKHNVLGESGDPASTIFPSDKFDPLVKNIPEYIFIEIMVNEKAQTAAIKVSNFVDSQEEIIAEQHSLPLHEFNVVETLNKYLGANPSIAEYFMGGDLGYSVDFAEFWVKAVIGERNRLVTRVKMLGVKYNYMREAFDLLDTVYDRGRIAMKSGIDIGGAGTALYHELCASYPEKKYPERCVPVQFGSKADELMPDGTPMKNRDTDKTIRRRVKTLATRMLVKRMQELTNEYPCDPQIISDFTGHTSTPGDDGDEVYSKVNDHTVDADRAGAWAYYREGEEEISMDDIATSGVPMEAVGAISGGGEGGIFLTGNGGGGNW